jgi:hypothetical protein
MCGAFRIDPHEETAAPRHLENLRIVHADGAIDLQPELRQLERQVPLDARAIHRLDEAHVLARGGFCRGERRDALAEIVERAVQALRLDGANGGDRVVYGLARDEPGANACDRTCRSVTPASSVSRCGESLEYRDAASSISACGWSPR